MFWQLGACNNLTIDISTSTGSGGRPWQAISWTVTRSTGGDVSSLRQYLVQYFVPTIGQLTIPRALFVVGTYSVTVTLTNFLAGSTAQSSTVTVSGDHNQPAVSILGSGYQTIVPSASLKLVGMATLSSCAAASSTLSYTWSIYNATGGLIPVSSVRSLSSDPTRYTLAPYTLAVSSTYTIALKVQSLAGSNVLAVATTTTSVFVASGAITAVVKGSSGSATRQVSATSTLVLDASTSTDDNAPLGLAKLSYHWSCAIASAQNYSQPCVFPSQTTANQALSYFNFSSSLLKVAPNSLTTNTLYNFIVLVTSANGRSSSKSVLVSAVQAGMPVVVIPTKLTQFNADSQVSLTGLFTANYSVSGTWVVSFASNPVALGTAALTPTTKFFNALQAVNPSTTYPLAVAANTFVPGRTYTFRLYVSSAASSTSPTPLSTASYAEITLTVNAPPTSGHITATPQSGSALTTLFAGTQSGKLVDVTLPSNPPYQPAHPIKPPYHPTLSTHPINSPYQPTLSTHPINSPYQLTLSTHPTHPINPPYQLTRTGWVDDSLPLSYDFWYSVSSGTTPTSSTGTNTPILLSLGLPTPTASISSVFPSGTVMMMGRAIDSFGAIANATTTVTVSVVANFNPAVYLSSTLTASLAAGSASSVYQSINAVSSMLSAINCTVAPNCTALHRATCHSTANTCGSCLQGYTGIVGDSNVRCQSPSAIAATAASGCKKDANCLFGACVSGVCITPNKTCSTGIPGTVCSGQGSCQFLDSSGSAVSSCLISNVYCSPQCMCSGGSGGIDCSLNPSQLATR